MYSNRTRACRRARFHISPWLAALFCVACALTSASAGQVGTLTTFTNGTVADADEVNANFAALETAVNDNDDRIVALEAQPLPIRIVLVSPVPGNDVASGAALVAAMAGITGNGAASPYLVRLEPGTYDLGPTNLVMKPYVDVAGSGRDRTVITGAAPENFLATGTLILGASNTELRDLRSTLRARYDATTGASLRNVSLRGRYLALEILTSGDVRLESIHAISTVGMRVRGAAVVRARDSIFEGVVDRGWPLGANIMDTAVFEGRHCSFRSEIEQPSPGSTGLYGVGLCTVRLACCELEPGRLDASGVTFRMVNCYDGNFDPHPDR